MHKNAAQYVLLSKALGITMSRDNFQASISGSFLVVLLVFFIGLILGLTSRSPWGLSSGEFSALSITFLAFIVSSYHFYSIRKHNQLSVKPHLQFEKYYDFDKDTKIFHYKLTLNNYGSGAAIIKKESLFIDGSQVKCKDNYHKLWSDLVIEVLKPDDCTLTYGSFCQNDAIDKGSAKTILDIKYPLGQDNNAHSEKEKIKTMVSRVRLNIDYECGYGNNFTYSLIKDS
jgi:hypothetical protein